MQRDRRTPDLLVGGIAAACLLLAIEIPLSSQATDDAETSKPSQQSTASSDQWLTGTPEEKFALIEKHLRGLDQAMAEIGYRYGELLAAAQTRNWDYAQYQTEKIDLSLRLAIQRRPKRAKSSQPFLNTDLPRVLEAIKGKDGAKLDEALTRLHASCVECHKSENVVHFREAVQRIRDRHLALASESRSTDSRQVLDAESIARAAGTKTTTTDDGVVRIGWARTEVPVKVDRMRLHPFAGLGSWAAFATMKHGAMVMGDTVVFQDEVTPAMDTAFAAGLEVTALHNHFFYDEPKVYFMHIGGTGEPKELAAGVKKVWDAIKKVREARPDPATHFPEEVSKQGSVTAAPIEAILGHKAQTQDGVVKVTIAREGKMHGVTVGGSMGLTTWAAFSGDDRFAAVDGDFIMTAEEVQPVLRALRRNGIDIVALHNHMIGEEPPFYFTHFWGKGSPEDLAKGIKAALDAQANAEKHGKER